MDTFPQAVYLKQLAQGGGWLPTALSRGPWDPDAQHGGAPAGLLAHVAESAAPEPGWQLARMTLELMRPVPIATLRTRHTMEGSRSVLRVSVDLFADEVPVARAHALLMKRQPLALPPMPTLAPAEGLHPLPAQCTQRVRIPGLPEGMSFYASAVDTRVAQGDPAQPGPAGAWFRLAVPLVEGTPDSPAMRAAAAADFGNGLSWVLPPERFLFANADLNLHLHREPAGEWIGLLSSTQVDEGGGGSTVSRLFDERGPIGIAVQTLALRPRR